MGFWGLKRQWYTPSRRGDAWPLLGAALGGLLLDAFLVRRAVVPVGLDVKTAGTYLNIWYASICAGSPMLALSSRSWMPRTICDVSFYQGIGQAHLLDRNLRLPALLLVQNRKADGSRGVDVRVEQRRGEPACRVSECGPEEDSHFGGLVGYSTSQHLLSQETTARSMCIKRVRP